MPAGWEPAKRAWQRNRPYCITRYGGAQARGSNDILQDERGNQYLDFSRFALLKQA